MRARPLLLICAFTCSCLVVPPRSDRGPEAGPLADADAEAPAEAGDGAQDPADAGLDGADLGSNDPEVGPDVPALRVDADVGGRADADADAGPTSCDDDDGDGYLAAGCGSPLPADCRTETATIHPGALELCGNGVDEDCSGADLPCTDLFAPLQFQLSAAGVDVTSRAAALSFGVAHNGHLDRLVPAGGAGENVVYTRTDKPEAYAGVTFYVSESETYSSHTSTVVGAVAVLEQGPAIVRYQHHWLAANVALDASAMSGSTTYTMHADGRVHRHEDVVLRRASTGNFTSYVGLRRAAFTHARWDVGLGVGSELLDHDFSQLPYNFPFEGNPGDEGYLCVYSPTGGDVLLWSLHVAGSVVPYGMRITESGTLASETQSVALDNDWLRSGSVTSTPGAYTADVLMFADDTGAMADPCVTGAALARAFVRPPLPTLTLGTRDTARSGDRLGDGFDESVGAYAVRADAGRRVALFWSTVLPPSLSLVIGDVASAYAPIVHRGSVRLEHGRDYLYQRASGGGEAWLVLARAPGLGETLRVDWP